MRIRIILVLLLLLSASPAVTQDDPCTTVPSGTLLDTFFLNHSAKVSNDFNAARTEATSNAEKDTKNEMIKRANGDGLTGSRLDLLRRAFLALDLGNIEEDNGKTIFNFNPNFLNFDTLGQFTPRVIVNEPVLFQALAEKIDALPEEVRQARKDALNEDVDHLDDVEAHLRWTRASDTPRAVLQEVATAIYEPVYREVAQQGLQTLIRGFNEDQAALKRSIVEKLGKKETEITMADACADGTKDLLLKIVGDVTDRGTQALTDLHEALSANDFFKLADLIEGEPRFSGEGIFRWRQGATGPDERSLSLRYELGSVSYRGLTKWATRRGKKVDVESFRQYLKERDNRAIPRLAVTVDYTEASEFHVPLPQDNTEFLQPEATKLSATAHGGWYFGELRNRRLELEASYDDVTDDPARQDRFVGSLSWVEKLNAELARVLGGSELVVTFIYASKPEFRGEVDEDLGLRAGFKWSIGGEDN